MPSPNPLPTKQKQLRGTVRKCREVNNVDHSVITKVPPAPRWLGKMAKKIYRDTTQHLKFMEVLEVTGLPLIVAYCIELGRYMEIAESTGTNYVDVMETKAGTIRRKSPELQIMKDSMDTAMKIGSLFGLDPVNKSRLKINNEKKQVDGLEEFLN